MRLAITDLGSNTIRTVLYENGTRISNKSVFAGVVQYIENNCLTNAGIDVILNAFSALLPYIHSADTEIAFATASLRGLHNSAAVLEKIRTKTGISVRLLSAEEEARYDYLGLLHKKPLSCGIGGDLGGGSMQLFTFDEGGLMAHCSLPLGSMRTRCAFLKGNMPLPQESAALRAHVLHMLQKEPSFYQVCHKTLYLTGGSIRAIVRLWGQDGRISADAISRAIQSASFPVLKKEFGDRAATIVPALLTLDVLLSYIGASEIESVESGVREGILEELAAQPTA